MRERATAPDWNDVDDPPGWGEVGKPVELLLDDGRIVRVRLDVDAWFDGEEEHPVVTSMLLEDGSKLEIGFFDAKGWRLA